MSAYKTYRIEMLQPNGAVAFVRFVAALSMKDAKAIVRNGVTIRGEVARPGAKADNMLLGFPVVLAPEADMPPSIRFGTWPSIDAEEK